MEAGGPPEVGTGAPPTQSRGAPTNTEPELLVDLTKPGSTVTLMCPVRLTDIPILRNSFAGVIILPLNRPSSRTCRHASVYKQDRHAIDNSRFRTTLEEVKDGSLSIDEAMSRLNVLPYEDLGFAKVDHHRALRKGFPEVVFGEGKSPEQIATVAEAMLRSSDRLLVTRATEAAYDAVRERVPDAEHNTTARTISVDRRDEQPRTSGVVIACAGTADLPVAREAAVTAELMDCEVAKVDDVGIAGIHRLFDTLPSLRKARVIVAVAGMEGALPSVIAGLVQAPVIAVPTSVGYGASFDGLAALLAMLNSCAEGVGVVNIDNGFGAGYLAALIAKTPIPNP